MSGAITGAGSIVGPSQGSWGLTIAASGTIENGAASNLTIGIGSGTIDNGGTIASTGAGGVAITSAIDNTGALVADGGTFSISGAVTGSGVAKIDGGTLDLLSAFNEAVSFAGATGELVLARSQAYTATIKGFSRSRGTALDLADIGFVSASEATFSGTSSGGVLTVSDGTHTAAIHLAGNYLTTTFIAADDGKGGVLVVAKNSPPVGAFAAAMAAFGTTGAIDARPAEASAVRQPLFAVPRTAIS